MNKKRVLIVDDYHFAMPINRITLKNAGYEVSETNRGDSAFNHLLENPRRFDLLIIDLFLPDISGLCLIKRIRERGISMPIIIISSFYYDLLPNHFLRNDYSAFLSKPFHIHDLVTKVEALTNS